MVLNQYSDSAAWTIIIRQSPQCAPGFLPEWNQDVPGAERVLGGSHTCTRLGGSGWTG